MYTSVCVCARACVCMCVHIQGYVCVFVHGSACANMCMNIHACTRLPPVLRIYAQYILEKNYFRDEEVKSVNKKREDGYIFMT